MAKDVSIIYTQAGPGPGMGEQKFETPEIAWEFLSYLTEGLRRNGFRMWYLARSLKALLGDQLVKDLEPDEIIWPVLIIGAASQGEAREWVIEDLALPQTGQVGEVEPAEVGL
jgi:hypothetical protein